MIYLVENDYTKKLYPLLSVYMTHIEMIPISMLDQLESNHTIIIDVLDIPKLHDQGNRFSELIQLGLENNKDLPHGRMISKYQSYKNIIKLLIETNFPIFMLTSKDSFHISPNLIESLVGTLELDYIISINYSYSSAFSLYDSMMNNHSTFEKGKTYDILSNFQDYMNPPIDDIMKLIFNLRKKGTVLIVTTPLKGPLDLALIKNANTLIWLEENQNAHDAKDIQRVNPTIQIINLKSLPLK